MTYEDFCKMTPAQRDYHVLESPFWNKAEQAALTIGRMYGWLEFLDEPPDIVWARRGDETYGMELNAPGMSRADKLVVTISLYRLVKTMIHNKRCELHDLTEGWVDPPTVVEVGK